MFLTLCSILMAFSVAACGIVEAPPPSNVPSPSITQGTDESPEEITERRLELTTAQGETIRFALNDSNAANSLYEQLPLSLEIENYSDNEKIFYPPENLDTSDTPMAKGPAGILAYYAPWGDVAIYYGDCRGASGLYQLGQVVSGAEYIPQLSGVIQLEAVSSNASSPVSTPPESTAVSEVPSTPTDTPVSPPTQEEELPKPIPPESTLRPSVSKENTMRSIQIAVENKVFTATLEQNDAANSFMQLLQSTPVVIPMSDYSGFEKVGSLGTSLSESNRQITAQAGDIILYNGNQICVFYGANSWSYTKLGKIDDLSGWSEALGSGDVTLTFSLY